MAGAAGAATSSQFKNSMSKNPSYQERCWNLKRYAIYVFEPTPDRDSGLGTSQPIASQQWKWKCQVADGPQDMLLQVNQRHMLQISKGDTLLENLCILGSRAWARAVLKGDSMLLTFKLESELKRIRIQFDVRDETSGAEQCRSCAEVLKAYFLFKYAGQEVTTTELATFGEVATPAMLARTVLSSDQLTKTYEAVSATSEEEIEELVLMCLLDPTFPNFVAKVQNVLERVVGE